MQLHLLFSDVNYSDPDRAMCNLNLSCGSYIMKELSYIGNL